MKMPIVSFAPMAMNESVCATCCYKINVSPTNYYWEVLHAGWIGERTDNYPTWREDIESGWAEFPFDVDTSMNSGMVAIPFIKDNVWWVRYYTPGSRPENETPLDEFLSGGLSQKTNIGCLHLDEQCLYIEVGAPPRPYSEHIDSTEPHTAAAGYYRSPHRAMQYHS